MSGQLPDSLPARLCLFPSKEANAMMDEKQNFSYLFGSNAPYIEELYEEFLNDPNSVEEYWRKYFSIMFPGRVDNQHFGSVSVLKRYLPH